MPAILYEKFISAFGFKPARFSRCPYRICPLGAHVDHQHGVVTGMALDRYLTIAYAPSNAPRCRARSLAFDGEAVFDVPQIRLNNGDRTDYMRALPKAGDWADYLRAAACSLVRFYPLERGVTALIDGALPVGGLSSSASTVLAFMAALLEANGYTQPPADELIRLAVAAENEYIGVSTGTLDQSCELLSREGKLLVLDTADGSYTLAPLPDDAPRFNITVVYSGIPRTIAGSGYNTRVAECRQAAAELLLYATAEQYKTNVDKCAYNATAENKSANAEKAPLLRDIPVEIYEKYRDKLSPVAGKRAGHYFGEQRRVRDGIGAWTAGDISRFGALMNESGISSVVNYEAGSPELTSLCDILRSTDGVYGARFSGAGFRGSCVALTDPQKREEIAESVKRRYTTLYPRLSGAFAVYVCGSADGGIRTEEI